MDEVKEIIQQIRKDNPDLENDGSYEMLENLEKMEDVLQGKMEVFNSPLIKSFVEAKKKEVKELNNRLIDERKMLQEERDKLFVRKDILEKEIIEFFDVTLFAKQLKELRKEARECRKKLDTT